MARLSVDIKIGDRPVISITGECGVYDMLVDTGADIPVWCNSVEKLKIVYPKAYRANKRTVISGFGGDAQELLDVWVIPKFVIKGKGGEEYRIRNLHVAVKPAKVSGASLIASNTMFRQAKIEIDNVNRKFSISYAKDEYWCSTRLSHSIRYGETIGTIYVFTQHDTSKNGGSRVICTGRARNHGKIVQYKLKRGSKEYIVDAEKLKRLISEGKVTVSNLKLTSDGRLIRSNNW